MLSLGEDGRLYTKGYKASLIQDFQKEYDNFVNNVSNGIMKPIPIPNENVIEFYHKNHFDYRGLIEKGLAIEITKDNNPHKR